MNTTGTEKQAETWRYAGVRINDGKRTTAWQPPEGGLLYFALRSADYAVGGLYEVQAERKADGKITLWGVPRFMAGDRDDRTDDEQEQAAQWAAADRIARTKLAGLARERKGQEAGRPGRSYPAPAADRARLPAAVRPGRAGRLRHPAAALGLGTRPGRAVNAEGPEGFYVTVKRSPGTAAERTGWLLGPYPSRQEAEAEIDRARGLAETVDPFTVFDAFGVTRLRMQPGGVLPQGVLNGYEPPPPALPRVTAYRHRSPK